MAVMSFRRQLTYKCAIYGKELVIVDRWFPSSKMDHKTGEINDNLKLSDRMICHKDGTKTDRDLNAAINLARYKGVNRSARNCKTNTVRHTGINAGGEGRSISLELDSVERCPSMKPEKNKESIREGL